MSSFETTELKLRTTPTEGVSGEHSPYYRRLLSAGYKGFMQGTIGGAGLYGFMGAVIGVCVAIPAFIIFPPLGLSAFFLVPAAAGIGVMKGASTFGNIGTVAAISAESADMSEQRRYLLDRYYDLPDGPDGDKQAALIKEELQRLQQVDRPHTFFHWKTVAVCAAIGGALALALCSPLGMELLAETPVAHLLKDLATYAAEHVSGLGELFKTSVEAVAAHGTTAATVTALAPTPLLTGLGTAVGVGLGALTGAAVGVDRHFIRKWFDGTEKLLHDDSHSQEAKMARGRQIERLREAQKVDNQTKRVLQGHAGLGSEELRQAMPAKPIFTPVQQEPAKLPIASLDAPAVSEAVVANDNVPTAKVNAVTAENRVVDLSQLTQL